MADAVLMDAIRRFWTREQVEEAYQAIFESFYQRQSRETVIIGKSSEGESATGQLVVTAENYRDWMAVLEARLVELDADAGGEGPLVAGAEGVNFGSRYVRT